MVAEWIVWKVFADTLEALIPFQVLVAPVSLIDFIFSGCCVNIPDGIAEALLCVFVYFSPTWRVYLLSLAVVSILILASMVLIPESPRWLMTNGRLVEMKKLMVYAAKWYDAYVYFLYSFHLFSLRVLRHMTIFTLFST